jgi:hypothetical protein
MLMNIFLNTITLQTTSSAMFIVILVAVGLIILMAVISSNASDNREEKEKDDWLNKNKEKIRLIDDFHFNFIEPLKNQVPLCRKCQGKQYQLWDLTDEILIIRCLSCKTKLNIKWGINSTNAKECLVNYISLVDEIYKSVSNQSLRLHLINELDYAFGSLNSNQPYLRAICFSTDSEKLDKSIKKEVNFINYTDIKDFNKDEYFEEFNISFNSVKDFFGESGKEINGNNMFIAANKFFENHQENKIMSIAEPALFSGVQRLINIHKNGVPNNIQDDSNKYSKHNQNNIITEKKSRRISQDVKDKVWNRDGGKCVECGSNENLEFDHIIPHSKGGANTYRNIQLLCEPCNRSKSAKIG